MEETLKTIITNLVEFPEQVSINQKEDEKKLIFEVKVAETDMGKVITLGEIMLRLSPEGNKRFVLVDSFDVIWGGGEANVAVSCANYGHDAYFVSKLPKHEIGQAALNALRRYGVHTEHIARGGDRVGIYYCETGASMRPSKVIYDRAHSAIQNKRGTHGARVLQQRL